MEYIVHLPHSRRRQLRLRMPGVQLVARRGVAGLTMSARRAARHYIR